MLNEKIKKLRTDSNLTQAELAKNINITRSALSLYELGKREPDTKTLIKIANYFDVSTDYLLGNSKISMKNTEQNFISEKISKLRKESNLSVNRLANLSGLSQGFVRQIELGEKNPTVESLRLICEALNISLVDFFKDEIDESKEELIKALTYTSSFLSTSQIKVLIDVAKAMNK